MKNFLVIYNAPQEVQAKNASITPEQAAEGMKPWLDWKERYESSIVDFGAPTMSGENLNAAGSWRRSGGEVCGYSILRGESLEAVREMLNGHHHLNWAPGCSIDVYECMNM